MPNASKQYGSEAHDISSINSNENKSTRVTGAVSIKFNRFSSFVKGGAEDFMLGKADARVRQTDQVYLALLFFVVGRLDDIFTPQQRGVLS